ncbi:hypothetical protein IKW72_08635 [bacterium]|nr:hypothetical protein [bacterium]
MLSKKYFLLPSIALYILVLYGCSADVDVSKNKSINQASPKTKEVKEFGKPKRATQEDILEAERNENEAQYSTTNAVALYVEKPMAWFAETNEKMIFTRQKLLEAQARISQICGKYERQVKASGDKNKGYLDLLDKAEEARIAGNTKGWPVAFDQWVIEDEEALNEKISEINTAMGKSNILSVEDTAMYNAAKKGLKTSRETLVRFDDAYGKFVRTWDKVKLGVLGGIPVEMEKDVDEAIDTTQIFINEWNKVK